MLRAAKEKAWGIGLIAIAVLTPCGLVRGAFAPRPAPAPSAVALSVNTDLTPNVVTATPSYGAAVEANGSRYEWQAEVGPPGYTVAGAGTSSANGQFAPDGTLYSVTAYEGPAYGGGNYWWLFYSSGSWALNYGATVSAASSGTPEYSVSGSSSAPPKTGWTVGYGAAPAPTVSPSFVGPDGTAGTYWTGPALVSGQNGVPALTAANSPLVFQVRSRGDFTSGGATPTPSSWVPSSSISYSGPVSPAESGAVVTAATYSVVANVDRFLIANAASNNVTFTLPDPTSYAGPEIDISRNDASTTYTVTVATAGTSKTVTNYTSVTAQYQVRHYVRLADGSGWFGF